MEGVRMERIDARRAVELLIDVVEQYGEDHVYERVPNTVDSCRYEYSGQPSCIVGHVLHRAGVPIDVLKSFDDNDDGVSANVLYEYLDVTEDAANVLGWAQGLQDSGHTWGRALDRAREAYETMTTKKDGDDV
jgi:hypothetical protein